jgi:hypothetical protein
MSTSYHETTLNLSDRQLSRLAHGEKVRLKHSDLSGDVIVMLTQTQLNRIAKAKTAGKGLTLELSQTQISACCDHKVGGGIFKDALGKVGRFVKSTASTVASKAIPFAKHVASALISRYGDSALDAVSGKVASKVSQLAPDLVKPLVDAGIDWGKKLTRSQLEHFHRGLLQGAGIHASRGEGLFLAGTH